jgi:3-methylfumaryl-CoA hydratase
MHVPVLADAGFSPTMATVVSEEQALRLGDCLNKGSVIKGQAHLPILWHWAQFLPAVATAELGPDGHPSRDPGLSAFPQRMWVGGRVHVDQPLRIGHPAERQSRLVSAESKSGSTGEFWLLTIEHLIHQGDVVCIREEQDVVLRVASAVPPMEDERSQAPEDDWVEACSADPVLLFRFSAVTGNAHRIHYDREYATTTEHYPNLVVHGPLTAILLADLAARRSEQALREVSFRSRAPILACDRFWLTGHPAEAGFEAAAVRSDHSISMTMKAR